MCRECEAGGTGSLCAGGKANRSRAPGLADYGKVRERAGTGFAGIMYWPSAARVVLFIGKHSAGDVFLQGLEGTGMCVVALAQCM